MFVYSAADASELLGGDMNEGTAATGDGSYQKKITPWEMMLETDVDLTKTLAREKVKGKRVRGKTLLLRASLSLSLSLGYIASKE